MPSCEAKKLKKLVSDEDGWSVVAQRVRHVNRHADRQMTCELEANVTNRSAGSTQGDLVGAVNSLAPRFVCATGAFLSWP